MQVLSTLKNPFRHRIGIQIAARVSDLIDRYCYSISGQIIAQNLMDLFTVCHKQRTNRLVLLCDIPT